MQILSSLCLGNKKNNPTKNRTKNSSFNFAPKNVSFGCKYKDTFLKQIEQYPQDKPYRQALAKAFGIKEKHEYILRPIIGLQEFIAATKAFNFKNYQSGNKINYKNDLSFVKTGDFRANFHCHSKHSTDAIMAPEEILNQAAQMGNINKELLKPNSPAPDFPFGIAITDHDELQGNIDAINLIKENPFKYRNARIVLGSEVTAYAQEDFPKAHILLYCINPFDKILHERPKSNGFSGIVSHLSDLEYGAMGIAHPEEMYSKNEGNPEKFFDKILSEFVQKGKSKAKFDENYYQSYPTSSYHFETIEKLNQKYSLTSTGSYDSHANNILTGSNFLSQDCLESLLNKNIK